MRRTAAIVALAAVGSIAIPTKPEAGILEVLANVPLGPWSNTVPIPADPPSRLIDYFVDLTQEGQLAIGRSRKAKLRRAAEFDERKLGALGKAIDEVLNIESKGITPVPEVPQGELAYDDIVLSNTWSDTPQIVTEEVPNLDLPAAPLFRILGSRHLSADGDRSGHETSQPEEESQPEITPQGGFDHSSAHPPRDLGELDALMASTRIWTHQTGDIGEGHQFGESRTSLHARGWFTDEKEAYEIPLSELYVQSDDEALEEIEDSQMPLYMRYPDEYQLWDGADGLEDMMDIPL